jgi:hypothetical protein
VLGVVEPEVEIVSVEVNGGVPMGLLKLAESPDGAFTERVTGVCRLTPGVAETEYVTDPP